MTYEEIKQRLTKCEVKLQEFQTKNHPARKSKNYDIAVEKLTLLKESLQKQLKEAEQGIVRTDDAMEAEKLAKKGINVDLKTEQDGVAFSKEETAAIAREVGKAVAKALHSAGDEVAHMKAKDIEPNSFEIYVQYKNDSDDQFSFYISEDTLHLQDFSFDKEIGSVGVKPSGEAIVHVDVLANELQKHFKSLAAEGMSDREWADAQEADRLEKHPEKDTIKKIQALIAAQQKSEATKEEEEEYHEKLDTLTHKTFGKRKEENEMKHPSYKNASNQYAGRSKGVKLSADEKEAQRQSNRDFIQRLKDKGMLEEAPEGTYYIKVAVRDARKALALIDDSPAYSKAVEMDGSDTYYLTDEDLAHDLLMDFGAHDIEVTDTTVGLDQNSIDQKDHDEETYDREIGENESEDQGGDLDIGHQDDEPDMLKQQVYDIATYAAKLYKALDKYDQMDAEVDFPNWWQSKVILARDYISSAQHYLEFEEKQPAIDALALEEGSDRTSYNKLKKEYDALVGKMKQLAVHFKTAEGEKKAKIVAALKQHTARKRELEKLIDDTVSGVGMGQELDTNLSEVEAKPIPGQILRGYNQNVKNAQSMANALLSLFNQINDKESFDFKKHSGISRVLSMLDKIAKTQDTETPEAEINEAKATCCGKCGRVHVKGTECKRPFLKGKDHCRYN